MPRDKIKILVTGARGYLGGRLILHLAERNFDVVGTTRGDTPAPTGWPTSVPFIRLNPSGDQAANQAALSGIDAIVHLSAANAMDSAANPEAAMLGTGGGTRRLLEAAISAGVRRFVFLSSIHVYGSPLTGRLYETTLPRPTHPYSISHMVGEYYVFAANAAKRIEGVSVRLGSGIGAPAWRDIDQWYLVGNDFVRQAIETGKIVVKTPGQWRDFAPLADVCAGIEILLNAPAGALGSGVFNLGGEMPLRIVDVAQRTIDVAKTALGRSVTLRASVDVPPGEAPPFEMNIAAMRDLGFKPSGLAGLDRELLATFRLLNA